MTLIVTFDNGEELTYDMFRQMVDHWHNMAGMSRPKRMICSVRSYHSLMRDLVMKYHFSSNLLSEGKLDNIEVMRTEDMGDSVFEFSLPGNLITTKWRSK